MSEKKSFWITRHRFLLDVKWFKEPTTWTFLFLLIGWYVLAWGILDADYNQMWKMTHLLMVFLGLTMVVKS